MWIRLTSGDSKDGSGGCDHWSALPSPCLGVLWWSLLGFLSCLLFFSLPLPALLLFFEECSTHRGRPYLDPSGNTVLFSFPRPLGWPSH